MAIPTSLPNVAEIRGGSVACRPPGDPQRVRTRLRAFAIVGVLLAIAFLKPLIEWARAAIGSDLNSHVLLVPFIVAYLVNLQRHNDWPAPRSSRLAATGAGLVGVVLLVAGLMATKHFGTSSPADRVFFPMASFVCLVWAAGFATMGSGWMRLLAFPAAFLVFVIPIPSPVEGAIEFFLQHASAEMAALLYGLTGTPFVRTGQTFQLPGITITVAQECSGIHSSYVLFMTSLLAGHLLLRSGWKKALFAAAVVPLGILRNACRILTISLLCIHDDPTWIDSRLHHRGGPVFFVVSLIPLFALLLYLRRGERRASKAGDPIRPMVAP